MAKTSSFWNDRVVLLTGASGLVGSWLVDDLLSQSARVGCLGRDRVPHSRFFSDGSAKKVTVVSG